MGVRLTHVGGPTVLIEIGGWRLLTDPTFDPAGGRYRFGLGTGSEKLAGPALGPGDLGEIDAALVSHDHHEDNLDAAGRALLPSLASVLTTASGAGRLRGELGEAVRGLEPGQTTTLSAPGKETLEILATPCRHGPPLSHPLVGDVVGFALRPEGAERYAVWISGDTVLYDAVRAAAERLEVDVALLHLGGVRFPISGPLRYTMNDAEAIELAAALEPRVAIPIHYEGWKHFRQGRDEIERELAAAPAATRERFRWLEIGAPAEV
jgi:L-ascorbate metabolism protein UlaG (beta-lactamase superfamily)